jgi:uncharacterized membrane protein YeaQ/YmgE (transglycosylase-associated protein family)
MSFILFWLIFAFIGAAEGKALKGRAAEGFLLGLLLGILGLVIIPFLGDHRHHCPACRGVIPENAQVCMHCGSKTA